jgi:hypothetical protein
MAFPSISKLPNSHSRAQTCVRTIFDSLAAGGETKDSFRILARALRTVTTYDRPSGPRERYFSAKSEFLQIVTPAKRLSFWRTGRRRCGYAFRKGLRPYLHWPSAAANQLSTGSWHASQEPEKAHKLALKHYFSGRQNDVRYMCGLRLSPKQKYTWRNLTWTSRG